MAGCNPCNRDFEVEISDHDGEHPSRRVKVKSTRASQHGPAPTTPATHTTPATPAVAPLPANMKRRSREYSGSYGNFKGMYKSTDEYPADSSSRPAQQSTPAPPPTAGQQTEPAQGEEGRHHRRHSHRHSRHSHGHSHDSDNGDQRHSGSHSKNGLSSFLELLGKAFSIWELLNAWPGGSNHTGGSNHREGGNSHRETPAWENILRTVTEVIGEDESGSSTPPARESNHRSRHGRDNESER
ncbi:uncharacterized protein FOMMEDRAFT_156862 [Fomitiporia mediterranea MF3/22]|uniref:uncharacterized protein n=1 Tax=Fomitiporia mediterranea (strain MF3/22) TaxID=694068 RepID=UPI00044088C3|nr:uncharacterized protein FOMMEDRAFT_156862 [Fomitiporia mediterranea MF3/22]EJD03450.1 hypothetical protein FOMMEDRAFT_156862 [Fomitiporia mediterranea MF3/22]